MKMKTVTILAVYCFISAQMLYAQHISCGHDRMMEIIRECEPTRFDAAEQRFNHRVAASKAKNNADKAWSSDAAEYIIPVVVHVIHQGEILGEGANISYAQIQSQLDALNAAFSNYSGNANYLQAGVGESYDDPFRRGPNGVDTKIRFCLAPNFDGISPAGTHDPTEIGVIRYTAPELSTHQMSLDDQTALFNFTHPTGQLAFEHYFNIWIVQSIEQSVLGYAPIPVDIPFVNNGQWLLRGVVVRSDVFGDNSVNGNTFALNDNYPGLDFDQGKVMVHEVGHALGLYHTFHAYSQNGSSSCDPEFGDLVEDTPPCNINGLSTYNGVGERNTCAEVPDELDMVENFMYYSTDPIANTFTQGQAERMANSLAAVYPQLYNASNLIETGVVGPNACYPALLTAEFTTSATSICLEDVLTLTGIDTEANLATNWQWSVTPNDGVNILNPLAPETTITFEDIGTYTVSLTVMDANNQSLTYNKNIAVAACELNACAVEHGNFHMVFGHGAHLDFSSGIPVSKDDVFTSGFPFLSAVQANFTQSDSEGNLLFYTDGNWVWGADHEIINFGNPLVPTPINGEPTIESTNQIIGVPFPEHPDQYILLLPPPSEEYSYNEVAPFRYAIIDFSGLTPTVSDAVVIKTTEVPVRIQEAVTIIPHCNGRDYWVFILERLSNLGTSYLYSYLLSGAGIELVNTYTIEGFAGNDPILERPLMATNRNGDRVVIVMRNYISVLDFDSSTGAFDNQRNLLKDYPGISSYEYDAFLSPSGEKLYVRGGANMNVYDIEATAINLSITDLYTGPADGGYNYFRRMFLGPDDAIYFIENRKIMFCGFAGLNHVHISQIQNVESATPVVTPAYLVLDEEHPCLGTRGSTPMHVDACKSEVDLIDFSLEKNDCNEVEIQFDGCYPQYQVQIDWGDASGMTNGTFMDLSNTAIAHAYAQPGQYTIALTLVSEAMWDIDGDGIVENNAFQLAPINKSVTIAPSSASIEGANIICAGTPTTQYVLDAGLNGHYQWTITESGNNILGPSEGSGINSVQVNWNAAGTLEVLYDDGDCTISDELIVSWSSASSVEIISACDSYTWIDGETYTESTTTPTVTLANAFGCDSLIALDLTIVPASMSTDEIVACDSYTWQDGNTYTASNNSATVTLTNASGCDSIVTLDLTVNQPSMSTDEIVACDSYTWQDGNTYTASNNSATVTLTNASGCDSIVTLDLTINQPSVSTDEIVACDSYTWQDGNTYTESNASATVALTNVLGCDSIVTLDLTINQSSVSTEEIVACESYTWQDGNTYTESNISATMTLTNALGCDSIVTLDLTITQPSISTEEIVACESYTWQDGNTYTESNTSATVTLTNALGCDSIVTLDLTINQPNMSEEEIVACESYTWQDGNTYTASNTSATVTLTNALGCDSIVTLDLTIQNTTYATDVIEACDAYTWIDGNTYTASNYETTFTLENMAGCDSLVTLNLTIITVDTSLQVIEQTITANASPASYQWLDCEEDWTPIPGATAQSFTPDASGQYAVAITENGCVDTSACVRITLVGQEDLALLEQIQIYPNPNSGQFFVILPEAIRSAPIKVFNQLGQVVHASLLPAGSSELALLHLPKGIYYVEIEWALNHRFYEKIVIK